MKRFWLLLGAALVIPACGGGGGGGGAGGGDGGPAPRLPFRKARGTDQGVSVALAAPGGGAYLAGFFRHYDTTLAGRILRIDAAGSPDPAFSPGIGFNSQVFCLAAATDGSGDIFAGGNFSTYDGSPTGPMVRLNADGTRDTSFTWTGTATIVSAIAPTTDGSGDVYVSSGQIAGTIARLNSNGSVDAGFAPGTGFNERPECLLALSGDVYAAGDFTFYQGLQCNRIVRLNSNGARDTAFAIGTGFNALVRTMTLHAPSGDLYVGGNFTLYNSASVSGIARLNFDGTLDGGFVVGTGANGAVRTIAFDAAGRVLAGGQFTTYGGQSSTGIVRLTQAGAIDLAFPAGFVGSALAIVPAQDATGDVIVGGTFSRFGGVGCNGIARITAAGAFAPGFMSGGGFDGSAFAVEPAGDGSGALFVGGVFSSYNGTAQTFLTRLDDNGNVDPLWAPDAALNGSVEALCAAGDGSGDVYVGGNFTTYGGTAERIVRLNADGTRDSGFQPDGLGFNLAVTCIVRAADGSGDIFVGGDFGTYSGLGAALRIARLNADGSLDTSFAPPAGPNAVVRAILPANDGSGDVYIGGEFTNVNGTSCGRIARLNANGTLDGGFATGAGFNNVVRALALVEGSSQIYAGGDFTAFAGSGVPGAIRLTAAGSRDGAFVPVGVNLVTAILPALDGTGGVYVAGGFGGGLRRLQSNGSIDSAFNMVAGVDAPGVIRSLRHGAPGELYAGGSFPVYESAVVGHIARIFDDGSLDE